MSFDLVLYLHFAKHVDSCMSSEVKAAGAPPQHRDAVAWHAESHVTHDVTVLRILKYFRFRFLLKEQKKGILNQMSTDTLMVTTIFPGEFGPVASSWAFCMAFLKVHVVRTR